MNLLTLKISRDISESRALYRMNHVLKDENDKNNQNIKNNENDKKNNENTNNYKIKRNVSNDNFIKYQWSWVF